MQTRTPFWRNPRFWLMAVVVELILMAVFAPDFYTQGWHWLVQVVHIHLP